jgi:hypothetical protein
MNKKLLLKEIQYGFRLGGKQTFRWASLGIVTGLIAFTMDLFLAICLQRFFVSTGLVSDLNQTRFFGTLRTSRSEAILLLIVGALRMFFYWVNTASKLLEPPTGFQPHWMFLDPPVGLPFTFTPAVI